MQRMVTNGIIKRNVFSIEYSNKDEGLFILGEYPKEIDYLLGLNKNSIDNKNYLGYCDLNYSVHWSCDVSSIKLFNTQNKEIQSYEVLNSFVFDSGSTSNVLKEDIYKMFYNMIFLELINEGWCDESKLGQEGSYQYLIACYKDRFYESEYSKIKIHFRFSKFSIYLNANDYMADDDNLVIFRFIMVQNLNVNIFGDPTLKGLITAYDGEGGKFYFYSDRVYLTDDFNKPEEDNKSDELDKSDSSISPSSDSTKNNPEDETTSEDKSEISSNDKDKIIIGICITIGIILILILSFLGYRYYKIKRIKRISYNNYENTL